MLAQKARIVNFFSLFKVKPKLSKFFWSQKLILFGFCLACTPPQSPVVDWEQAFFPIQEPDELFFKNVRQIYYRSTKSPENGYTIYTHNYWQKSRRQDYPRVELLCDWRHNRANLRIVWQKEQNAPKSIVGIYDKENKMLVAPSGMNSAEIAYEIYQASKKGKEAIQIKDALGDYEPLWQDKGHQAAAKASMYDFIKLIGQY